MKLRVTIIETGKHPLECDRTLTTRYTTTPNKIFRNPNIVWKHFSRGRNQASKQDFTVNMNVHFDTRQIQAGKIPHIHTCHATIS